MKKEFIEPTIEILNFDEKVVLEGSPTLPGDNGIGVGDESEWG